MSASENILLVLTGLGMLQGILLSLIVYLHPSHAQEPIATAAGAIGD